MNSWKVEINWRKDSKMNIEKTIKDFAKVGESISHWMKVYKKDLLEIVQDKSIPLGD